MPNLLQFHKPYFVGGNQSIILTSPWNLKISITNTKFFRIIVFSAFKYNLLPVRVFFCNFQFLFHRRKMIHNFWSSPGIIKHIRLPVRGYVKVNVIIPGQPGINLPVRSRYGNSHFFGKF